MRSPDPGRRWVRSLAPHLAPHRRSLVLAISGGVVGQLAMTMFPLIQRTALDEALVENGRPLGPLLALALLLGLVAFAATVIRRMAGHSSGLGLQRDLSRALHRHVTDLDVATHDRIGSAELLSRTTADVALVQRLASQLHIITGNLTTLVVATIAMTWLSPLLALVVAVIVPAVVVVSARLRQRLHVTTAEVQDRLAVLTGTVARACTNVPVVRAFAQEDRERRATAAASGDLAVARSRVASVRAHHLPILEQLPVVGQAVVLLVGGWMAIRGSLTVGTLVAFSAYLIQIAAPARTLAGAMTTVQAARVGAMRVLEVLDLESEVAEVPDAQPLGSGEGAVEFRDVTFSYPGGGPVLRDLRLQIPGGERIAICGPSGAGKSTIGLLLARLHDVDSGSITIDGTDIRRITVESLRSRVSIAFEDSSSVTGSIADNIALGRPGARRDEIVEAARRAQAHRFISQLPRGYDTPVSEAGRSLSGGQRQRIDLARTLLVEPHILVLDDATSAVDPDTERSILAGLAGSSRPVTTILIARRLAALETVDRVVFVDHGRIVADGDHHTLLERDDRYRAFVDGNLAQERTGPAEPATGRVPTGTFPAQGEGEGLSGGEGEGRASRVGHGPLDLRLEVPVPTTPIEAGSLLRGHRRELIVCLLLLAADAAGVLVVPLLLRWGIDRGVVSERFDLVAGASILLVAAAAVAWLVGRALIRRVARVSEALLFDLRCSAFDRILRTPVQRLDEEASGSLTARITNDVDAFAELLDVGLLAALTSAVGAVGVTAALIGLDVRMAAAALAVVPPALLATMVYRSVARAAHDLARTRTASVYAVVQEELSVIDLTKVTGGERRAVDRFARVARDLHGARLRAARLAAVYFPFLNLSQVVAKVSVLAVAGRIGPAGISAGVVAAALLLVDQLFSPLQQLSAVFDQGLQAGAGWRRLRELDAWASPIGDDERVLDAAATDPIGRVDRIELVEVEVVYGAGPTRALGPISTRFERGVQTAIVGASGAGKTTLARVLLRFVAPSAGVVLFDGEEPDGATEHAIRRSIGYVPQEPRLFAGTIASNIAYGRPSATIERIRAAAAAVGADQIFEALPDGYLTEVGEAGTTLAAGVRQLVCLARAVLIDPAVLILDEATAELDPATDRSVSEALRELSVDRIAIVIAHRPGTARAADRVLVLDEGLVTADGPPSASFARPHRDVQVTSTPHPTPALATGERS